MTSGVSESYGRLRVLVDTLAADAHHDAGGATVAVSRLGRMADDHGLVEEEVDLLAGMLASRGIVLQDDCRRRPEAMLDARAQLPRRTVEALALALRELPRHPVLTPERELALARAVVAGDQSAAGRLIDAHAGEVPPAARRHGGEGLQPLDLIQAGVLGLIDAGYCFAPSSGVSFASYAAYRVRTAIGEAAGDDARAVAWRGTLEPALGLLPSADAALLRARYGTGGDPPAPAKELARRLGIPRPVYFTRERAALGRLAELRNQLAAAGG